MRTANRITRTAPRPDAPEVDAPRGGTAQPTCAGCYVAVMARHHQRTRRDQLARIERWTASRVAWTVTLLTAVLCALVTTAAASPAHARDCEDAAARGDDAADDREDRGEIALELDADGDGGGAIGGGPGTRLREPAVAHVLEAAYAVAGLNRDPMRSWSARARAAGLIPWVTVRTGWDQSWHDDEPGDVGRHRTFEVRATWRLDRLLFDGRELQMSTIDTARRRERRRLASRVIRAYFAWRKLAGRGGLAAEAAVAELDALTDGWFSERAKSAR